MKMMPHWEPKIKVEKERKIFFGEHKIVI